MRNKVFLSWSGGRSREIAKYFHEWAKRVIQNLCLFYSDTDIQKGEKGRSKLDSELRNSCICIVFLTKENNKSEWINYEVGMVNSNGGYVSAVLLNLNYSDVFGPLSSFQHTIIEKNDFLNLIKSLNTKTACNVEIGILTAAFDIAWPDLQKKLEEINRKHDAIDAAVYYLDAMPRIQREACLAEVLHLYRMPDGSAPEKSDCSPRGEGSHKITPLRGEAFFYDTKGNYYNAAYLLTERKANKELHQHWLKAQRYLLGPWGDDILDLYEATTRTLKDQADTCYIEGTMDSN